MDTGFSVLGPLEVSHDGRLVELGGRRERAVLAVLVLHAGDVVSVEQLIDGVWGEARPSSAKHMVHEYVSRLRRALTDVARLATRPPGYVLELPAGALDVDRFEALRATARAGVEAGNHEDALRAYDEALALWRGDALGDIALEGDALASVQRLDEERRVSVEERLECALLLGRHAQAIPELEHRLEQAPLRERTRGLLMLALYRDGRQADALERYREGRALLVDRTGIEPGRELRDLERAILRHDPSLDLVTAPARERATTPAPARRARVASPARHVLLLVALLGLVAAIGVLALVLHGRGGTPAEAHVAANSVGVLDARSGAIGTTIAVGDAPGAIAGGAGGVWVANASERSVSRIDPETSAVTQTIAVGEAPSGVAVGGGDVWVTNGLGGTLSRISPETNAVTQTIHVGNGPAGVAFGGGAVWVADSVDGTVSKVDPRSGRVIRAVPVANGVGAIAYGFSRVWVVSSTAGELLVLDPASGAVVDRVGVGSDPDAVATGAGAVWVANRADGTLTRIAVDAHTVTNTIPVGRDPVAVAADAHAIWVANAGSGTVSKVDPTAVRVVDTARVGSAPSGVAATADGIYVAVRETGLTHRGGTLRLLAPQRYDSLDPALAYAPTSWSILTSTSDGLVGFRRSSGIGGIGVVPDLAASLPTPADGGRTWTFRLRPGIRYSNGALVEPEDFRRALVRLFQIVGPRSPAVRYFSDIAGAGACTPARCDLSRGIETDPRARTITFRLTAPDADFLAKLALPFAYPVPVSTPARDQTAHPVPGTGPYRVARVQGSSVRLVRNRFFREWSSDAQPAGYPDVIEWSVRPPTAGIRAVQRGAADAYLFLKGPLISKAQLAELAIHDPGELRENTVAATHYFFLNTRVPPFSDVRARRAVNDAFGRQAFATLLGRGVAATCQILPPNSPSFRRVCPYLPNGGAGLAEARRLVRASGTAGQTVVVWIPPDQTIEGGFFVSELRALGYAARLRVVDEASYFDRVLDTRTRAQAGFDGWQADFPSESAFLTAQFACSGWAPAAPGRSSDPSFFCDHALDRLLARAGRAEVSNAPAARALWQAAERDLLRAAPVVPTFNPRTFDFVARHVGDYQYNPQWGALADQLWLR